MELIKLRRIAAAGMGPQARGRSLTMCMVINGDPTWRAGVAPIIRWAQEVWSATIERSSQSVAWTLPQIRAFWM
eukprot:242737-Heterocapsa_arctica.AAC.1